MNLRIYPKEALFYFLSEVGSIHEPHSKEEALAMLEGDRILRRGVQDLINKTSIFADWHFIDCWNAAFPADGTVCLKTSFGACAYNEAGELLTSTNNRRIGKKFGLPCILCPDENCIREKIVSRRDPIVGECDHAPMWMLSDLAALGYHRNNLALVCIYEAGFLVSEGYKPWWRKVDNYTCLYCARLFLTFGLKSIYGTFGEDEETVWRKLDVAESYQELARKEVELQRELFQKAQKA